MAPGVRERIEERERSSLSPWATAASGSKGRERQEAADPIRTAFQSDRDRILSSLAFRRMADKTHCFIAVDRPDAEPPFRTRMVHTLAVARVARTLARALRANEDLVEAIAYGADLGATPYGSAGEEALAGILDPPFRHEEQSLRVVETLAGGSGMNLTWEVRDGILAHPTTRPPAATLEGQIVRLATRMAMVTDALADALSAGLLSVDELPEDALSVLGRDRAEWGTRMIGDVVEQSADRPEPTLSPEVDAAQQRLERFLRRRVLSGPAVRVHRDRAVHVLRSLVVYLLDSPERLPGRTHANEATEQRIVDLLASLGDRAATRLFVRCFTPGAEWP